MIYCNDPVDATLVRKVNRFLALVIVDGEVVEAHIPNSGRLGELMIPGYKVLLQRADNQERKTAYTLKSVYHAGRWVCIDSLVPNALALEIARTRQHYIFQYVEHVKREFIVGRHRFDLLCTGPGDARLLVEIKSVTLVKKGVAYFPDAPTERGRSHLRTLARLTNEGYRCAVLFMIQRSDAKVFRPNIDTDPDFGLALQEAIDAGVMVDAVRCRVGRRSISMIDSISVVSEQAGL